MISSGPTVRDRDARRQSTRWSRIPAWLVIFAVFTLTGLFQFAAVDWSRPLSIYDEVPHVDYVLRLADGDVTTWDDVYSQRTLGLASCLEDSSPNPQCISERVRDPQERWPNGYSYEALQAPLGYLPFVLTEIGLVDDHAHHYSQIRQLRLTNAALWVAFAALWTSLILQVTNRRLSAAAASIVVALNPLLFDRFTYVTTDSMAIITATGIAAWFLHALRTGSGHRWWSWVVPSVFLGGALGLVKPTAMIVLLPVALAVLLSQKLSGRTSAPLGWWIAIGVTAVTGMVTSLAHQMRIAAISQMDSQTVLSLVLPKAPLDFARASLLRITDVSELLVGTGERTEAIAYEWGVRSPSAWVVVFTLAGAAAFFISLTLRNDAFPKQSHLDQRLWAYSVLAGFIAVLVAVPAVHFMSGGYVMPFTAGRFQAPLIPLAGLVLLPAYQRFRSWAWTTVIIGLLIAAFASAPIGSYLQNFEFLI